MKEWAWKSGPGRVGVEERVWKRGCGRVGIECGTWRGRMALGRKIRPSAVYCYGEVDAR